MRRILAWALVALVALGGSASAAPLVPATLVPAPIVSRGRRVESSPGGGKVVVDGVYRTKASWAGGHPTVAKPSWVAIEIGPGPSRLLVSWTSSGNHD